MIRYLCGICGKVCRITFGTTRKMSMGYCISCGFDYFHADFEDATEDYSHWWIDLGGEG